MQKLYDFGNYGCPVCRCHASMAIGEGFVTRLFCAPCQVSWTVYEAEEDDGPLCTFEEGAALERRQERPRG